MISFSEAKQLVKQQAHSFGTEMVSLDDAVGRVIAEKIFADRDYPPFNRSMMDGIAFKIADWQKGLRQFKIKETIYAGKTPESNIASGECYKIMTGAAVPLDADTVIRKEDLLQDGDIVVVTDIDVSSFQSIAKKGEDLKKDEIVINASLEVTSAVVAVLASIGKYELLVEKLPKVAVITTGDEVIDIVQSVTDVQIRNSNLHVLRSLLKRWSIAPVECEHVPDDKVLLQQAIAKHQYADILILNGGVSAGDADYVPDMLTSLGARQIFHKVAIKPGKPIWFGKFENGAVIFALPGNPFSCMITFKLFIELLLTASFGIGKVKTIELPFNGVRIKKSILDEFFPAKIIGSPSALVPVKFNSSGDITAAMFADAIVQHPADKSELINGDIVNCILL